MRFPLHLHLLLFAGLAAGACKKTSETDLSTPESTLESFFNAVNEGRIPSESDNFIMDEAEIALWKLRCRSRGCKKVDFKILRVEERGERGALLTVDYEVFGKNNQRVMGGKESPIRFERHNSRWGIVQFGRRVGAPAKADTPTDAGTAANTDTAADAGTATNTDTAADKTP